MKLRQLTGSIIVAATLFTSTLPANANPFGNANGGIFKPIPAANTTSTPVTTPNGNSEVQGLGDHQSWVDQKTLFNDPRALCSDVSLGNNTRTSATELALANSTSTRSSSSRTHKDGGGGGFNVLGIVGANGSGSSQGSQNNSDSKDTRTNRNEKNSSSSSTVAQGKNCDAFVNSAAARDMNFQDNLTRRYEVKTGRRGQQVNQLLENK